MAKEAGLDVAKFRQDLALRGGQGARRRRTAATAQPPASRRRPRSTSTAASTPTAATPTACANGSRTRIRRGLSRRRRDRPGASRSFASAAPPRAARAGRARGGRHGRARRCRRDQGRRAGRKDDRRRVVQGARAAAGRVGVVVRALQAGAAHARRRWRARLKAQGIDVLAVSVDQERANVDKFLQRPRPLGADHRPRSRRARSPSACSPTRCRPLTSIDRAGIVRYVNAGFVPEDAATIEQRLLEVAGN